MADDGYGSTLLGEATGESLVSGVQGGFGSGVAGIPLLGPSREGALTSMGNTTCHTGPQYI